jgi:hypothetical protein
MVALPSIPASAYEVREFPEPEEVTVTIAYAFNAPADSIPSWQLSFQLGRPIGAAISDRSRLANGMTF